MLSIGRIFRTELITDCCGDCGSFYLKYLLFWPCFLIACSAALIEVSFILIHEITKGNFKLLIELLMLFFDS